MSGTATRTPFLLLTHLYGDPEMAGVFSAESMVDSWLRVEAALDTGQAEVGVLTRDDAASVVAAARRDTLDLPRLWAQSRNVGYPILGLVRQFSAAIEGHAAGRV